MTTTTTTKRNAFEKARYSKATGKTIGAIATNLAAAFTGEMDTMGLVILELALEKATGFKVNYTDDAGNRRNLSSSAHYVKAAAEFTALMERIEADRAERVAKQDAIAARDNVA